MPQNNPLGTVSDVNGVANNVADLAANGTMVGIIALAVDRGYIDVSWIVAWRGQCKVVRLYLSRHLPSVGHGYGC